MKWKSVRCKEDDFQLSFHPVEISLAMREKSRRNFLFIDLNERRAKFSWMKREWGNICNLIRHLKIKANRFRQNFRRRFFSFSDKLFKLTEKSNWPVRNQLIKTTMKNDRHYWFNVDDLNNFFHLSSIIEFVKTKDKWKWIRIELQLFDDVDMMYNWSNEHWTIFTTDNFPSNSINENFTNDQRTQRIFKEILK